MSSPMTPDEIDRIVELYREHGNYLAVSRIMHRSCRTIARVLKEQGVRTYQRGDPWPIKNPRPEVIPSKELDRAIAMERVQVLRRIRRRRVELAAFPWRSVS